MSDRQKTMNDDVTRAGPEGAGRAELVAGTQLGRYEILRLLGRGGMGQVYLARHELQKTLHALKILPSEFSGRAGFVERFQTELQTMARMQHPNIVHIQYSDIDAGLYYFVMDFVASDNTGEPYDLEEALAVEKRFEPEIVRRLMLQLCGGLSFAHGQGVVHRDLKPANVLLTSKDLSFADVKICDFGLARVIGEEQIRTMVSQSMQRSMGDQETFTEKRRSERSSTGSVMGTYGYMSPEQEEGKPADERSDLYALGVMMYRMVTGQRLRGRAKAPSAIVPGLDKAWDDIIDKCLEYDPMDRWKTADELKVAVESIVMCAPTLGNVIGMAFVKIAAGSFQMGSDEGDYSQKPVHTVRITRPFWMGKYEVTQKQWREIMGDSPSFFKGDNLPVEGVNWERCVEFCKKLTEREQKRGRLPPGYSCRLPTEAEWEFAARGGSKSKGYTYSGGNDIDAVAWHYENSGRTTHPVGKKLPNELGLFDMSGNVFEWCLDWYDEPYSGASAIDPSGAGTGFYRVCRGGSFEYSDAACRAVNRHSGYPFDMDINCGFRVILASVP